MRFSSLVCLVALVVSVSSSADVTVAASKFSYYSGDGFIRKDWGCSGMYCVHRWGKSGGELSRGDCPKTARGEVAYTYNGTSGKYDIEVQLFAKGNHSSGGATWWLKVNSSKVGGGNSLFGGGCSKDAGCSSKTACKQFCSKVKAASGVSLKSGDKIIFGGTTSWPCGCSSARGGYYTGFASVTIKGAGGGTTPPPPPASSTKILEPTGSSLTIGKKYTLKAEGKNISWFYDISGDNKPWFSIAKGNEISFTIPDVKTDLFTLKAEGDGGSAEKGFQLSGSTTPPPPAAPATKLLSPTETTLTIGKKYTLKAEGKNISWFYDISGDNKPWFDIADGNEVTFTVPNVKTDLLTLKVEGDGGSVEKGYKVSAPATSIANLAQVSNALNKENILRATLDGAFTFPAATTGDRLEFTDAWGRKFSLSLDPGQTTVRLEGPSAGLFLARYLRNGSCVGSRTVCVGLK